MQEQLSRCRYGWAWEWSKAGVTVPLEASSDGIYVTTADKGRHADQTLRGDCISLSTQLGNLLTEKFKNQYKFYVVQGNFPNSGWEDHFFIVGWPKAQNVTMLREIDSNRGNIPAKALIIDPSYGLMEVKGPHMKHRQLRHYYAEQSLQDVAKLRILPQKIRPKFPFLPFLKQDRTAPDGNISTIAIPFGFMRELMPKNDAHWNQSDSLAMIRFQKQDDNKPPKLLLGIFNPHNGVCPITVYPDWRQKFPPNSKLYQSLDKVERRLNSKIPELIRQFRTNFICRADSTAETQTETASGAPFQSYSTADTPANHAFTLRKPAESKLRRILLKSDEPAEQV